MHAFAQQTGAWYTANERLLCIAHLADNAFIEKLRRHMSHCTCKNSEAVPIVKHKKLKHKGQNDLPRDAGLQGAVASLAS